MSKEKILIGYENLQWKSDEFCRYSFLLFSHAVTIETWGRRKESRMKSKTRYTKQIGWRGSLADLNSHRKRSFAAYDCIDVVCLEKRLLAITWKHKAYLQKINKQNERIFHISLYVVYIYKYIPTHFQQCKLSTTTTTTTTTTTIPFNIRKWNFYQRLCANMHNIHFTLRAHSLVA